MTNYLKDWQIKKLKTHFIANKSNAQSDKLVNMHTVIFNCLDPRGIKNSPLT